MYYIIQLICLTKQEIFLSWIKNRFFIYVYVNQAKNSWFLQNYISPYLFGQKPKKKPVESSLAELEAAVGSCVEDVKAVRSNLQTLTDQKAAEMTNGVIVSRIQEVKSEINSLKSLLLNRLANIIFETMELAEKQLHFYTVKFFFLLRL